MISCEIWVDYYRLIGVGLMGQALFTITFEFFVR